MDSGNVTVSGGSIAGNSATNGGAIYSATGAVAVSGGTIGGAEANTASANGGAIYIGSGSATVSGGSIAGNSATNGGAIYSANGSVTVSGGTIGGTQSDAGNTASENGGAIYLYGGSARVSGGSIVGNTANENGGGIYATADTTLTLNSGTISGCTAQGSGGGVYTTGTLTVKGSSARPMNVTNCTSVSHGGGIYAGNTADLSVSRLNLTNCQATGVEKYGGGLYTVSQNLTLDNVNFTDCKADYGAGLSQMYSGDGDNKDYPAALSMSNSEFTGCEARASGGGVYTCAVTVNANNSTFTNCTAKGNNGHGGGIWQDYGAVGSGLTVAGCTYTGCEQINSDGSGGGAIAARAKTLEIRASSFANCKGATGGAVYHYGAGINSLNVTSTTLTGCNATGNSNSTGFGGGIYASAASNTLNSVTVKNCTATVNGGGVYQHNNSNAGTLTLSGGTAISGGSATNGGGVYAEGNVTMSGKASVANNSATANGGGVALEGAATLTMSGSAAVTGNSATDTTTARGGGVYVDAGGALTMSGSAAITGNGVAVQDNGGGVYLAGKTVTDEAGKESEVYGTVHVQGAVKIADNRAGSNASNLAIYGDESLVVDDNLSSTAAIGICTEKEEDIDQIGVENGVKKNLNKITYDRDTGIYAIPFGTKKVVWNFTPVVKLTDSADKLLYRNADLEPAVYATIKEAIDATKVVLVDKDGKDYAVTAPIKLKLLLDYTLKGKDEATGQEAEIITYDTKRNLTMTTAEKKQGNTDGYFYTPAADVKANDPRYTCATVTRGHGAESMFTVNTANTVTVSNLIIDGDKENFANVAVNGGLFNVAAGKLTIADGATLRNSSVAGNGTANGNGGAVYVDNGATAEMTGGTITGNAAVNGGAVYAVVGATVIVKDGTKAAGATAAPHVTITGNTTAEYGAGIYLAEGATLNLEGSPSFGGTGRAVAEADSEIITEDSEGKPIGNFASIALAADAQNGQKDYGKFRQDIYMAGYQGVRTGTTDPLPATSIVVTGAITSDAGSIWVAAEKPGASAAEAIRENNHYEMLKQFAVFANGVASDETTMQAFRNAWDDESTGCGADYLTGQDGDDLKDAANKTWKCIYWTGGFDFVFRKLKEDGQPLDGAKFTLFMAVEDPANSGKFVPAMKDASGKYVPAESTDETTWAAYEQTDKEKGGKKDATAESKNIDAGNAVKIKYTADGGENVEEASVYGDGLAVFEKIPPGVYFMVEKVRTKKAGGGYDVATGAPKVDGTTLDYQAVEEMYRVVIDGKGWYAIHVADRNANGQPVWDKAKKEGKVYTWPNAKNAPTVKLNDIDLFTVLNVDARTRKVILKKVDGSNTPLNGAEFTVLYADKQSAVRVQNGVDDDGNPTFEVLKDKTSGTAGAFWIGKLPFGSYYLHETKNAGGTAVDIWFILTVNENGVGYLAPDAATGTKPVNKINPETTKP